MGGFLSKSELESREASWLATYAMQSGRTAGRRVSEPPADFRTDFQRDRDRILHSAAFRRLEYKTQVFVNHEGDHYRTRLTHTLEAAQIAVSISRALKLNDDLTEAITLAHDLGHTPFGHSGERAMNELMAAHGGFEHNLQSLRIVDSLEHRYPNFAGLNLTYEVREGIAKHSTPYDKAKEMAEFDPTTSPLLEAQIADVADEVAYNNHDVDDGLSSNLLSWDGLMQVQVFREAFEKTERQYPGKKPAELKHVVISTMIGQFVDDLVRHSSTLLADKKIQSVADVRRCPQRLICFSPAMEKKKNELKDYLMQNMYLHWRVIRMEEKAKRILRDLFNAYMSREGQIPKEFRERFEESTPIVRLVCDYLAGMTDRFALDEHKKFFDPHERV